MLADANGVISSDHMHWFFQAEGSREFGPVACLLLLHSRSGGVLLSLVLRPRVRYDDEKKLQALMLKLDTNGDGTPDASSIGLRVSGRRASIVGTTE